MRKSTITFDTVRKIGLALPGVEESTAYGSPALKVHGKLLACVPAHQMSAATVFKRRAVGPEYEAYIRHTTRRSPPYQVKRKRLAWSVTVSG